VLKSICKINTVANNFDDWGGNDQNVH
jgi:hypothetical protein